MEQVIKEAILITPEVLEKLGWSKKGNAWYPSSGNKRLTNFENKFQSWTNGTSKEVLYINEI